jgi:hypothetical protein
MSFNNTYFEELLFEKQEGNKSSVLEQWRKTLPGELVFFNCLLVAVPWELCHLGFRSSREDDAPQKIIIHHQYKHRFVDICGTA